MESSYVCLVLKDGSRRAIRGDNLSFRALAALYRLLKKLDMESVQHMNKVYDRYLIQGRTY